MSYVIALLGALIVAHAAWLAWLLQSNLTAGDLVKVSVANTYADTIRISTGAVGVCIGWLLATWSIASPRLRWLLLCEVVTALGLYLLTENLVARLIQS